MKRARKPRKLFMTLGKVKQLVAIVHEDYYGEHFDNEVYCDRSPTILGFDRLFEGCTKKEQIAMSQKLSEWFLQYAAWLKTTKEKSKADRYHSTTSQAGKRN